MIVTDEQRRWWFANHPEYSSSRTGQRKKSASGNGDDKSDKLSPEEVDAGVDERLKYERDDFQIFLLNEIKFWFGTEFESKSPAEKHALLSDEDEPEEGQEDPGSTRLRDQKLAYLDDPQSQVTDDVARSGDKKAEEKVTFWDAVVIGIDNTFQDWERWFGFSLGLASPSRALARNLEKAGKPRPDGHSAHRIVAADDWRATEARRILDSFGIKINDAVNGVWLPYRAPGAKGVRHASLHTNKYYKEVEKLLRKATTGEGAVQALERIGHRLSEGKFPK